MTRLSWFQLKAKSNASGTHTRDPWELLIRHIDLVFDFFLFFGDVGSKHKMLDHARLCKIIIIHLAVWRLNKWNRDIYVIISRKLSPHFMHTTHREIEITRFSFNIFDSWAFIANATWMCVYARDRCLSHRDCVLCSLHTCTSYIYLYMCIGLFYLFWNIEHTHTHHVKNVLF